MTASAQTDAHRLDYAGAPTERPRRRWSRKQLRDVLVTCGLCCLLLLYTAAGLFGRGGRGFFSPDTLECRTQLEWLIPLTEVPLYRGPYSRHRWLIVDYLVAQGLWSKSDVREPRWLFTFQWNQQWRDGQSQLQRELAWRGKEWVQWSEDNPELAKILWPRVLSALRKPGTTGTHDAEILLFTARGARSVEELEGWLSELSK